eukprot:8507-Prymnesium_polylepis.1
MRRVLPLVLLLTFIVVPSTSSRIFQTFRCDSIEYNNTETRRYLHADIRLNCDTEEYETTRGTA